MLLSKNGANGCFSLVVRAQHVMIGLGACAGLNPTTEKSQVFK